MAELVYAYVSEAYGAILGSSSLPAPTQFGIPPFSSISYSTFYRRAMPSDFLAHAPRGAAAVLSSVMVASVALWGVGVPVSQVQATNVSAPGTAPQVIDMSTSTVADIVAREPDTDRFYLLLLNAGALSQISGAGPYQVYAPENKAIDYLPHDQYLSLSAEQKKALAQAHIGNVPLPAGVQIVKEYEAQNGVVYIINEVLPAAQ